MHFQEVTHIEKSFLAHTPSPSTGITVVCTQGLSERALSLCDGGLQLLWLRSLPDVRNGIKISGMPSLLASSITVAQTVPPRASSKPSSVGLCLTLPIQLTGQGQRRPSLAGSRTADGWAQPASLGKPKPALKRHFRRPVGCHGTCFGELSRACAV